MTTNYKISDIYKHKETLKPIEELKIYLEDIIVQIESELNIIINNSDGNGFNWRERKVPSFMNKYTSNDKIFLKINLEINKISDTNIIIISETIEKLVESYINNSTIIKDKEDKEDKEDKDGKENNNQDTVLYINKCADYLTKNIYETCYIQDISFSKNYINLFQNIKNKKLLEIIKFNLKEKNKEFSEFIKFEDYSEYQFNNKQFINIGYVNGLLYEKDFLSSKESYLLLDLILKNIFSLLEWKPVDKDILEKKVNLMIGFLLASHHKLWDFFNTDTKQDIEHQIQSISNHNHIPNKIRYSILDMNDKIIDSLRNQEKEKRLQEKKEKNLKLKKYENKKLDINRNNNNQKKFDNHRNNNNNYHHSNQYHSNNHHNNHQHNNNTYGYTNNSDNQNLVNKRFNHNKYNNNNNNNHHNHQKFYSHTGFNNNREQNNSYHNKKYNQFKNKNIGINNRNYTKNDKNIKNNKNQNQNQHQNQNQSNKNYRNYKAKNQSKNYKNNQNNASIKIKLENNKGEKSEKSLEENVNN